MFDLELNSWVGKAILYILDRERQQTIIAAVFVQLTMTSFVHLYGVEWKTLFFIKHLFIIVKNKIGLNRIYFILVLY